MKKYIFLLISIVIVIVLSKYLILKKHLDRPNPTYYVYDVSIDKVRENIISIFSNRKFHNLDFKIGYNLPEIEIAKITEGENKNHFFINWFGWNSSGEDSKIYYNWWGTLKLIPKYHIILDSITKSRTKITIESFPKVKTGIDISFNHGVPYFTSFKASVAASTIEEYEIIRLIGIKSGETNMPVVESP